MIQVPNPRQIQITLWWKKMMLICCKMQIFVEMPVGCTVSYWPSTRVWSPSMPCAIGSAQVHPPVPNVQIEAIHALDWKQSCLFFHSKPFLPKSIEILTMNWNDQCFSAVGWWAANLDPKGSFGCQDTSPPRWWCTGCRDATCASSTTECSLDGIFWGWSKGLVAGHWGQGKICLGDTIYGWWPNVDNIIKVREVVTLTPNQLHMCSLQEKTGGINLAHLWNWPLWR